MLIRYYTEEKKNSFHELFLKATQMNISEHKKKTIGNNLKIFLFGIVHFRHK